ncbi:MAG: hypothetical protein KF778_22215 [Rhodocyclaceae bacterium]|nr:hypothetical protein [Rhodocyclaceae bacterium]MBX3671121.1 hypothetical protein [Rhodocyclaceae bacterium]
MAIVNLDHTALRAGPRDGAQQQALLTAGDVVEIRGERMNYLQVYDHRRERAGYIRADRLHRMQLSNDAAPALLEVLRHLRDQPGAEALGLAYAAAWIQAAPAEQLKGVDGLDAFDALGTLAERLARRASLGLAAGKPGEAAATEQLEAAAYLGIAFKSYEQGGRMHICYTGDAFQRVLAADPRLERRATAALALTRAECTDHAISLQERARLNEQRAELLDRVATDSLPPWLKNRLLLRRASVWSSVAFARARSGDASAAAAAERALGELASVAKSELPDEYLPDYNDAAMRANAVRWAALPPAAAPTRLSVVTTKGQPGETCVALLDVEHDVTKPLLARCTYGMVWTASAAVDKRGSALALAVQPLDGWRELWVFRMRDGAWAVDVLPPTAGDPGLGYIEFAGWAPNGSQMLIAREARSEGKYRRSFEVLDTATLAVQHQAPEPAGLAVFQRWQDALWKRASVALR